MTRPLRIALFTYPDPTVAGGVQEATFFLSTFLEKRGHRVTVFGPAGKPMLPYRKYRGVCHAVPVPMPNGNLTGITVPYVTKPALSACISPGRFDLCHIQDPQVPFVAFDLLHNLRIPIVATFNASWDASSSLSFLDTVLPILKPRTETFRGGIIFVSEHVSRCWSQMLDRSIPQSVIYPGVDPVFYTTPSEHPFAYKLLFVGRLVQRKGWEPLLETVRLLVRTFPMVTLTIAGDGPDRQAAERYVEEHGLKPYVRIPGRVSEREKYRLYGTHDIFCAPYSDEAFGITALEAMAAGLPVVGFMNGPFQELFRTSPAKKLLVENGTIRGLSSAFRTLFSDKKLYHAAKLWARGESRKYTWENAVGETEKFYGRILTHYKQFHEGKRKTPSPQLHYRR
ncbi:glycosyltransferase family 4 protein [Patescibacteria group bacterium]|nr:glycosyltransferase family 4 protein [Patescibacteria group bacterium]